MPPFVHLHLHTQYSVLDGANKIKDVVAQAAKLNQQAIAITDHANMHGAIEFYQAAKAEKIRPIIGCEVYITPGSRFERTMRSNGGAGIHHLTLLAKDATGYRNLCRLVTNAYTEGFYFKPRIDHEILKEYNQGLICLSGCLSGELSECAKNSDLTGAKKLVDEYLGIFGDRYYLEVQPHKIAAQKNLNALCAELGQSLGVPLVATNDCHYLLPEDHLAQEVLMCISTGKLLTDPDRMRHENANLHFKTAEEMLAELPGFESAVAQSYEIANRCELELDFNTYYMPKFDPPPGETIEALFSAEARSGFDARVKQLAEHGLKLGASLEDYFKRLEFEIELIIKMGFASYFLVVSDFILWAKRNEVPVGPGRGSAAGSLVAWAMSITEVDPIPHKLLFERFLNPERVSLPDIDIDFCINGRDRVIEYVCQKYGKDKVAQICTFGTLKAKAAIKDVGRALGMSYAETDRIAKLIPAPRQGFDYPLAEALKMEKRLQDIADGKEGEEGKRLIDFARKLEGLSRHTSTHAAGIVIADRPVVELLPLMLDKDDQVVTQFSMSYVEKIGLVKFDFLGLKTLTVLHEATRLIKETFGKTIELEWLPLDDPKTYQLISAGRTIGVFQLESSGITDMVGRLRPNRFDDLVAILALYRPGPLDAGMVDHYINRKHKREPVKYSHPLLETILGDTYGIILYQEQIMQIAQVMAGYTLGEADMLRRAMGKKKPEEMAKQRSIFVDGAKKRGVANGVATEVFDQMETFARYGFNRSHSAAYAMISFQTAYLKAHYPVCFMAALMTHEMSDTDRTLKNLNECRELGIEVLPPDVNRGGVGFSVSGKKIVFGLAALKGVGEKVVEKIIEIRKQGGAFKSFFEFCKRGDATILNRRVLESFIKGGAFDWTGAPRADLMAQLDDTIKWAQRIQSSGNSNQIGLFGGGVEEERPMIPNYRPLPEWPVNIKLSHEKEALGFYLSGHPLAKFKSEFERLGYKTIDKLKLSNDGAQTVSAGVVTVLKLKNTKKGDRYATFVLEDMLDTIEVIVWPDTYLKVHQILGGEDPVLVSGRVDVSDERVTLVANNIESAIALRDRTAKEAIVKIRAERASTETLSALKKLLAGHRGECPVKVVLQLPEHSETVISLPPDLKIEPSERLCNQVEALFGEPVMIFR